MGDGRSSTCALSKESDHIGITSEAGDNLLDETQRRALIFQTKVTGQAIGGEPSKRTQAIVRSHHDHTTAVADDGSIIQDAARRTLLEATARKENHHWCRLGEVLEGWRENIQRQAVLRLCSRAGN